MAYVIENLGSIYQKEQVLLTPESKVVFDKDRCSGKKYILKQLNGGTVPSLYMEVFKAFSTFAIPYIAGLTYPKPSEVYKLDCPIPAKKLHNFIHSSCGILVSQAIVDLIEELEPGVHQFFPVELLLKSGEETPQPYYILNICKRLQTLDLEKSDVYVGHIPKERQCLAYDIEYRLKPEFGTIVPQVEPPYRLLTYKDKIDDHAIWAEYGYADSTFFISEQFHDRVMKLGGFDPNKVIVRTGEI